MMRKLLALVLLLPSLAFAGASPNAYWHAVFDSLAPCAVFHYSETSGTNAAADASFAAGGCAASTVGTYHSVTLNKAGILGAGLDPAILLNGTSSYVESNFNAGYQPDTTLNAGWSEGFWFVPNSTSALQIITANTDNTATNQGMWIAYTTASKFRIHLHQDNCQNQMADTTGTATCAVGAPCFIMVTSLGAGSGTFTHVRVYVNSVLDTTITSFSGTFCSQSLFLRVGQNAGNWLNATQFDELFFANQEYTQGQVTNAYNAGLWFHQEDAHTVKLDNPIRWFLTAKADDFPH